MPKKNKKDKETIGDFLLHPGKYRFGLRDFK
jgi:hypothetical protein